MIYDIVSAVYKGGYNIELTFDDGKKGVVDFVKYLENGGVFEKFKNIEFFKNFSVNQELGVIAWEDEIDIAPETLYSKATGSSLPNWMRACAVENTDLDTVCSSLMAKPISTG